MCSTVEVITLSDYIEGMIRTQIQLTGDQVRTLKRAAADQGVSIGSAPFQDLDAAAVRHRMGGRRDP